MRGKICLVTGANRGIGRATAEGLAHLGATVIMACRNRAAGEQARREIIAATGNAQVELLIADLAVQAEVRMLAEAVRARHQQLHLLISNAGGYYQRRVTTVDGVEATFAVNHLAGVILIDELLGTLRAAVPARIVLVASEAHRRVPRPEDWQSTRGYGPYTAYARSKLANVMFGYDLARRLKGTGITVNSCHPGIVDSQLLEGIHQRWWSHWLYPFTRRFLTITAEQGARTVLYLATAPELEGVTGGYYRDSKPAASSARSRDGALGVSLREISRHLTGKLPVTTDGTTPPH